MIVDDSAFMRLALEKLMLRAGDIVVCDSVSSGETALEHIESVSPDVVTMDVEMPGMNGIECVRAIMARRRTPIIMLSSFTTRGTEITIRALENGAADCIAKPTGGPLELDRIGIELIDKIRSLGRQHSVRELLTKAHAVQSTRAMGTGLDGNRGVEMPALRIERRRASACIGIGISTGGPAALAAVCSKLQAQAAIPILVVQHMPAGFTKPLAERLDALSGFEVVEAYDRMVVEPGRMIIGVAGKQMRVRRSGDQVVVSITDNQRESLYTPSADILFASMAQIYGNSALGIIMTGMGHDGVVGLQAIKQAGGYVYGQDAATSVVYGMPRAASEAGLIDATVPLSAIPDVIEAAARGFVI
jgi:two-component system chemotaxis response regulator CheB